MTSREYIRNSPKVKWCADPKCKCMVPKIHKHFGPVDFVAYPKGF